MGLQPYERMDIWTKVHMVSSTGSMPVPLSADVTAANVYDNQVYPALASRLPSITTRKTHYMTADPGYDDQNLYDLSTDGVPTCMSCTSI